MQIEGWIKILLKKQSFKIGLLQFIQTVVITTCHLYPFFNFRECQYFQFTIKFNLLNGLSLSKRSTPGTYHSPETHLKVIWFNFSSSSNLWGTFWNYTYWPHFRSKTRFNNGNQNVLWWSLIWFNVMFNRIMIWYDTRLNLPVSIFIEPSTNSFKIPKKLHGDC